MEYSGWGNYPVIEGHEFHPRSADEVRHIVQAVPSCIPRGNGRSYGDASLHDNMISSLQLNKKADLNPHNGTITCDAGVLLGDILNKIVPQGFFLPVIPGTQYVTVGGAIAADIHGKNHYVNGSFSRHVLEMKILLSDGEIVLCSPSKRDDLFWATFGASGLTGFIISATLRLVRIQTSYLRQESIKTKNLAETLQLFDASSSTWRYCVAWLDATKKGIQIGRSLVSRGNHIRADELRYRSLQRDPFRTRDSRNLGVPQIFPSALLNARSLKLFNNIYYQKQRLKSRRSIVHYQSFFFPLDRLRNWNKLYGKSGLIQYQVVIPEAMSTIGIGEILYKVHSSPFTCTLAVLKKLGAGNPLSPLSFPMAGITVALDFKRTEGLFSLLDQLDDIVKSYGGRVYLAKDSRMRKSNMRDTYPEADRLVSISQRYNPALKFRSHLSNRLGLTPNA